MSTIWKTSSMSNSDILLKYNLGEDVTAFSTTRHGGVSTGAYTAMNINPYCGDNLQHVAANRTILANELGIADDKVILPHQVHGISHCRIDDSFFSLSEEKKGEILEGKDIIMTDLSGVCIGVSTADCIPILLHDKPHHVIAAVHAGWRGTKDCAVVAALAAMKTYYHTDPSQVKAVIGPGISFSSFEVGDEVYEQFKESNFPMDIFAGKRPNMNAQEFETKPVKWHIDLPYINRHELLTENVRKENILMSDICTYQHHDDFFSARRLGISSGRIFTGIMLTD